MATPRDSSPPRKPLTTRDEPLNRMMDDVYGHLAGPTYYEGGPKGQENRWRTAVDETTGDLVTEWWNGSRWVEASRNARPA